jgi:putative transposase
VASLKKDRPKDIGKACRVLKTSRSSMAYQSIKDDSVLIAQLQQLAVDHPREGFWKCHYRLRNAGGKTNHKRLHRVYKLLELPLRRKSKKRLPARVKEPLEVPAHFTHTWSIDFMSDALMGEIKFRTFNVIDDYNREVLFIEADYSLKSSRVIWVLRHLINRYGKPQKIRMDNGPEFIATLAKAWSMANQIEFKYTQPGKPTQNAYIERFNKSFRNGVLDAHLFKNLDEVREVTAQWVADYNQHRPHKSLGNIPPVAYRKMQNKKEETLTVLRSASATPSLHAAL